MELCVFRTKLLLGLQHQNPFHHSTIYFTFPPDFPCPRHTHTPDHVPAPTREIPMPWTKCSTDSYGTSHALGFPINSFLFRSAKETPRHHPTIPDFQLIGKTGMRGACPDTFSCFVWTHDESFLERKKKPPCSWKSMGQCISPVTCTRLWDDLFLGEKAQSSNHFCAHVPAAYVIMYA